MKKLALALTFVFSVAMIAPAFAVDPVKKEAAKTECSKEQKAACAKDGKACCKEAAAEKKDGKACCAKPADKK